MSPKIKYIGFRTHGHVRKAVYRENEGFSYFPKTNPKNYLSRVEQNNSTEFLSYSFNNICNKNGPPGPHVPQIRNFVWILRDFPDCKVQGLRILFFLLAPRDRATGTALPCGQSRGHRRPQVITSKAGRMRMAGLARGKK